MEYGSAEFKDILRRVREGAEAPRGPELLPFLALGPKEDRYRVNMELAAAYMDRHERGPDPRAVAYARSCVDRALLLSRYSEAVIPLLTRINLALKDVGAVRDALKRAAIGQAARGNFDRALLFCDLWMYGYTQHAGRDMHTFDPEVIACVERMAALHRFDAAPRPAADGRPLRLAYLMHGLTQPGSVLVKIDRVFARLHDKSRFEVAYFSADAAGQLASSPDARAAVAGLRESGCQFFDPPDSATVYERLLGVGRQIHDFGPDLLVTSAALATFRNYFVVALRPAPLVLAFEQGSPPQFCWHGFDHAISWFQTTLLECPADASHVPLELDLPRREDVTPAAREELGIPEGAVVMVTGTRWQKVQHPDFWRVMGEALEECEDLYWLVAGVSEEQVPCLDDALAPGARAKVRFRGWSRDYLGLLAAGDFFVDSYPVGGGVVLMDAMALGIPALTHEHDYVAPYSNDDCSGGEEIVGAPELLVRRGDFAQFRERVSALAADAGLRERLGRECEERVRRRQGEPGRMVRRCEEVYERVVRERGAAAGRLAAHAPKNSGRAGLEEYKLLLLEQASMLNSREAEISRREAEHNSNPIVKVGRRLRRLTGWRRF